MNIYEAEDLNIFNTILGKSGGSSIKKTTIN